VFRVGGPDANTYLQGQFTQDLNRPMGAVSYGLFLSQKGKVVADAHILRLGSHESWVVSFSLAAAKLRERLEAYLIADEVEIADETSEWVRISIWGDEVGGVVGKLLGGPLAGADVWREGRGLRVFRGRRSAGENFEIMVPRAQCAGIEAELAAWGATVANAAHAMRERIIGGIPVVPVDLGLNDLPNEGGLDDAAISYTKGCYLGQEVMARLKNLGQVRRRLHIVRGKGEIPTTGALLFQSETKVGELRSVAADGDGFVAMAMLSLVNLREGGEALSLSVGGLANINVTRRV
jgi:folate-binding protein YgfZ